METSLRILYLEDDPNDLEMVISMLEAEGFNCEVCHVETRDDFVESIERGAFNIILSDYTLPAFDGLMALEITKEKCPDVPFVLVSGTLGEEKAIEVLTRGASDYVLKERLSRLVPVVKRILKEVEERNERKQAEKTLEEERKFIEEALDAQTDTFFVFEPSTGKAIRWNRAFSEISGYSDKEISAMKAPDSYYDEEDLKKAAVAIEKILQVGKGVLELSLITKDDRRILTEYSTSIVRDKGGNPKYLISVGRDLAERKKLEASLQQAQKMDSVGRLAGGVAHDFNNALSVIIGFTELAIDEVDPTGRLHANLDEVLKAAKHATDITRQLMAFARKQTMTPEVLDLNKNVESMLKMLRRLIGEDIELAWLPGASLWPTKMDPSQINQVLANLCVNARDAIKGVGKVTIETDTVVFDAVYCADHAGFVPGEFVMLAVSDNGCGMDKEILDNIFEPFFTTKDVDKGTGLGLATVYGIVKQNNGFINVYSEPDKGTTIKIYLSRHEGKSVEIQRESTAEIPPGRGETVLVAEDDLSILKLAQQILDGLGYTVLTAGTPGEAIDLAKKHAGEINLLVTDVIMPEMNGRDLAQRLQSLYPGLKSMFMSGYTANVIAHHGVLDEGMYFIQKPFSRRDLGTTVRKALGG